MIVWFFVKVKKSAQRTEELFEKIEVGMPQGGPLKSVT
jgi:hypothetical protein